MLIGAHVNFLQINLSEYTHTIVTWICVVLRLWPSGEPDNSCTRDIVMDACLWVVCVLKPLLASVMRGQWNGSAHFLQPQQGSGLQTPDPPPFFFHFAFNFLRERNCSPMNENDGSKDGVLLPVSHPMKAKSQSPCSILTGDVSTTLYQWTSQGLSHYLSNYIFLNCS